MGTEAQDDAALVARVLGGDKSAFGFLIDRHRPVATKLARRLFGVASVVLLNPPSIASGLQPSFLS